MQQNDKIAQTRVPPERVTLHEISSNAIRYWEPRRLIYNVVLALIVVGYALANWPETQQRLSLDAVLSLCILAVLANVCYCAAYVVDVFAQYSDLRPLWLRCRWVLFAVGLALAMILTRFFAMGFAGQGFD